MQHLLAETRLSLTALAQQQSVSASTIWRWTLRGLRGKRLESFNVGGRRYTTHEAFVRFVASTQLGGGAAAQPTPCDASHRAHRDAEDFLRAEGI